MNTIQNQFMKQKLSLIKLEIKWKFPLKIFFSINIDIEIVYSETMPDIAISMQLFKERATMAIQDNINNSNPNNNNKIYKNGKEEIKLICSQGIPRKLKRIHR